MNQYHTQNDNDGALAHQQELEHQQWIIEQDFLIDQANKELNLIGHQPPLMAEFKLRSNKNGINS